MMKISIRSLAAVAALATLGACSATGGQVDRAGVAQAMAARPAPNWFHLPERQPMAGERAVFASADGAARYEVSATGRAGERTRIRLAWLVAPPGETGLPGLAYRYDVDDRSAVRAARVEDEADGHAYPMRIAEAGEPGYVAQPTLMRLPVPEFVDTGKRRLRVDAVVVNEQRAAAGMWTQISFLSDEAPLGIARRIAVPAASLTVSDVVGLVAATRMQAGTDTLAVPLGEQLAPRLATEARRLDHRLVEE